MFGELIGLWAAAVWGEMGSPGRVRLVELGPGRGTLMADVLRAAKTAENFRAALAVDTVALSGAARTRKIGACREPCEQARRDDFRHPRDCRTCWA